ncbi:MAG: class I SAM-dependent methyltransferase [Gammaproteobacteria bacterium]|nr:class I SAM-dependent methyltransferase [Gammaproteobacteria bacterium]
MSESDRDKWNCRYLEGSYAGRDHPTALLEEWESELRRGRALDVACGAGRNSLFLASRGWHVDAVDISAAGLGRARAAAEARGLDVEWLEADLDAERGDPLEHVPGAGSAYDLIVLVRYVNAALIPYLAARLAEGGTLLCEEHLLSTADVVGPRSAAYRLKPGELLENVKSLTDRVRLDVLHYREGLVRDPDGRLAALAQLVLRRGAAAP